MIKKLRINLSQTLWNSLPAALQIALSSIYSKIYDTHISRYFIRPFCWLHSLPESYLNQFVSPTTLESKYTSFQDFFTRRFQSHAEIKSEVVWPCEGFVCDQGYFFELPIIKVKGEKRNIQTIFTKNESAIPNNYYFTNVFFT